MKSKLVLLLAVSTLTFGAALNGSNPPGRILSVEFLETPDAPAEVEAMAKTRTTAKALVTYANGVRKEFPLTYHTLFSVKDKVGGNPHPAGQAYDHRMQPLTDPFGQPVILETPDANSLLDLDGNLFLISHLEYDWLLSNGAGASSTPNWYRRVPTGMILTGLDQSSDGRLSVRSQRPIDFSPVNGTWINCFGSQTPWNTHLGSEEDYDLQYNPLTPSYSVTSSGLKAMTELYWGNTRTARPYHYGFIPEVRVDKEGGVNLVKHYAMGRASWEMALVMTDGRTVYSGDDGTHGLLAMFIADKAGDLSAGTLYAARWGQTSADGGGKADLAWVRLGHATDAGIRAIIETGTDFNGIFDAVAAQGGACPEGYNRIRAGSSADECLRVRPGMEQAAAFLETRRYAALQGATTEFTKMEGIARNTKDNKLYMAMSRIEGSMKAEAGAPADHIQLPENKAGATYTVELAGGQRPVNGGEVIDSHQTAVRMYVEPALLGRPVAPDDQGNTADLNTVANTDNLFFSEKMRTLFIGEDSSLHLNNRLWAYNIDTKKLTRILSAAAGAEITGLQVLDSLNGHAYIMSNSQHWGDISDGVPAGLKSQLSARIDRFHAPVGYIGGLPGFE
ncbi:MAG: hypothetical protein A2514_12925 [Gammaproteobacteria bacterium RIFOXYD12_FULL_61_37]|nr:MAG: hypothetical protein A2514_12925 [Gammaproteobacteria bacterium RIFOXYD12_FULL_61_37]